MNSIFGGTVEAWKPGFLIQDDANIAYQPTDKQGKQTAALVKLELTMIMWRARMGKKQYELPNHPNCRCIANFPKAPRIKRSA